MPSHLTDAADPEARGMDERGPDAGGRTGKNEKQKEKLDKRQ